ncbi:MAG: hypothetical protein ACXIUM_12125 [Wenzhouxiangella sp.]
MTSARDFHHRIEAIHPAWFHPLPVVLVTRLRRSDLGRQRLFSRLFAGPDAAERAALLLDREQPLRDRHAAPFAALFQAGAKALFELGAWCYTGLLQTVVEGRQVRALHQVFGERAYRSALSCRKVSVSDPPDLRAQFQSYLGDGDVRKFKRQVYRRGLQEAFTLLHAVGQVRAAAWYRMRFRPGRIATDAPAYLQPEALRIFCHGLEAQL